jgi:hypothetical protein
MKIITSALAGTVATAAMALVSASPAAAQNYGYRYGGYERAGSARGAVQQCAAAAEQTANRYAYGNARVTDIRDIDHRHGGFRVKGRIEVNGAGRGWRGGDRYYGSGWNRGYRGSDSGTFTCDVRYGQIARLDFNGIRGL